MEVFPFHFSQGETEVCLVDHVLLTNQTRPSHLEEMEAIFLFHPLGVMANDPYHLLEEMENLFHP